MSPIWVLFALVMCGVLLFTIIGVTVVLCLLDSHDGPRVRHVESTPVTPRQLSIREIADVRARHARGIDTHVVKIVDDLYEMVHGNKHHEG